MFSFAEKDYNHHNQHLEHLSLKVPNNELDFDVSVDCVQWQTVTLKSNLI